MSGFADSLWLQGNTLSGTIPSLFHNMTALGKFKRLVFQKIDSGSLRSSLSLASQIMNCSFTTTTGSVVFRAPPLSERA